MNFFINKAMGVGNSGVEHAQFYRAKLFDSVNIPYRYIFTALVKELSEAMAQWQLRPEQVINIWEFFTFGEGVAKTGMAKKNDRVDKIIKDKTNTYRIVETLTSTGLLIREHIEKSPNPKTKSLLVAKYKTEIFDAETGKRKIMFNDYTHPKRGRFLENIHVYDFEGEDLFFRNEVLFQRYFFECLDRIFAEKNTFIIDRGEESEVALFGHRFLDCHLVEIIHADHLADRVEATAPAWNNHYEYLLTHMSEVDRVIVATELQREDFLIDFPDIPEKIVTIPVGGIDDKQEQVIDMSDFKKAPTRFMTASRLASEKHIDLMIQAFATLHEDYPEIIFDIYGQGGEDGKLREKITELEAGDYIQLKGHSNNLEAVYKTYDVFVSASYSEGFGLTYIEALNAGLPIVTFKARFGAMELVKDGVNGYIKDFVRDDEKFNTVQLVSGMLQLLESDYPKLKAATIASVEQFQDHIIAEKWRKMLDEL
ncbi:accessory Sec system glycosyltransferase GtfA [Pseudolactococcus yaeyamensis]